MKKVLITSDSTTDLSPDLIERFNVKINPLGITLGDGRIYTDGVDIDPDFIYAHYEKTGILPKTSATNIAECIDFFQKYVEEGYAIVHFTLSSSMSSTYQNACLAAAEFEDVYVVDSCNLSNGGGLLVVKAGEMMQAGASAEEIYHAAKGWIPYVDASFIIDSLEFLHKGGRCSSIAAFGANVLGLKPSIVVRDGAMTVGKKYRGKFNVVVKKYIKDMLGDGSDIDMSHVFLINAGCDPEIVETCEAVIRETIPVKELHKTKAGCTISSHCGKDTVGVMFMRTREVH